jgi:hypothetical protein
MCHERINGLGFALENFDPVGNFRQEEGGKPIDSTGHYVTRADERIEFDGVADLAPFLANSDDAHRAFVARAFQHFVKQPPAAFGAGTLERLTKDFKATHFNIRKLIVEICLVASAPNLAESAEQPQN